MTAQRPGATALLVTAVMLSLLHVRASGQAPPGLPRLSGIVDLSDAKLAILEAPLAGLHRNRSISILSERERVGGLEVVKILPKTGTVRLNIFPEVGSSELTLRNTPAQSTANISGLMFENASLEPVLELYARFCQRTLLRWPKLPELSFSMVAAVRSRAAAARALRRALNEKGLATIPDGEKFMIIVPQQQAASVKPHSSEMKPSGAPESEAVPSGAVYLPDTDIHQVLEIYAKLCGRNLDQNVPVPPTMARSIHFHNQTALSRAEVVYALDTVLGWAGLKMVPSGHDQMKPVPIR